MSKPNAPYQALTSPKSVESVMAEDAGPAIIDLWAPWCQPCLAMAPHFEAVAEASKEAHPDVAFYKIDTEAHPSLGAAFHVRSIPTLLFVNAGEIVDVHVGMMDAQRLSKKVEWLSAKARGEGFFSRLFGKKKAAG